LDVNSSSWGEHGAVPDLITEPDSVDAHDVTIAMSKETGLSITKAVVDRALGGTTSQSRPIEVSGDRAAR
jgi:flagellar hook-basal body complex protein FliE